MNKAWKVLLLLSPLLWFNLAIAFLYAHFWCKARSWKLMGGVLTFIAAPRKDGTGSRLAFNPGAQGWSPIVGYCDELNRSRTDLRAHENTHVFQELVCAAIGLAVAVPCFVWGGLGWGLFVASMGGPLFIVTYLGTFLINYIRTGFTIGWDFWAAYRAIPYEKHAYRVGDEYLDGKRPKAWV